MRNYHKAYDYILQDTDYYLEETTDEEDGNGKLFHTAVRKIDNKRFSIHWSPYCHIDQESFRIIVLLKLFDRRCILKASGDQTISVNWNSILVKEEYNKSPLFHNREDNNNVD